MKSMKTLGALLLTASVTTCTWASGGIKAGADEEAGTGAEPIKIEFWVSGSADDSYERELEVLELYNELHPETPLEIEWGLGGDATNYQQKLQMAASSDTLPEIFAADCSWARGMPERGVLTEITEYFDADKDWSSRYVEDAFQVQYRMADGKKYGVPYQTEIQGWYLNKRLFDEQGLEIPTAWEDWVHCIEVFKEADIIPIVHAGADTWARWGYDIMLNRYGYQDSLEALKNGETTFADFALPVFERADELAKMGAYNANVTTCNATEAIEMFKGGQAAMITTGSWELANMLKSEEADNFVISWGPEFSDSAYDQKVSTKSCHWTYWLGRSASENEEKLNAILEYLKLFSQEEMVTAFTEKYSLVTPNYYKGDESKLPPLFVKTLEKVGDDYTGYSEMSSYLDPSIESVWWNAITAVITQTATPEEAVQQLDDAMKLFG